MKPSWNDRSRWSELVAGSACPFCTAAGPRGIIATLDAAHVTMDESVAVRGYCCVILRHHATELHHLDAAEGAAFMRDVQRAAAAVQATTGAIKLNYEIHGNVVPHVHLHLIPRYPGDAIETSGQGFAAQTGRIYSDGEFEMLRQTVIDRLAMPAASS